jgi:hypothetical protein
MRSVRSVEISARVAVISRLKDLLVTQAVMDKLVSTSADARRTRLERTEVFIAKTPEEESDEKKWFSFVIRLFSEFRATIFN